MGLSVHWPHSNIIANLDGNLNWQGRNYPFSSNEKIERFADVMNGSVGITRFLSSFSVVKIIWSQFFLGPAVAEAA